MKKLLTSISLGLGLGCGVAGAACCYFAALNKDVTQPGQRAFITWDGEKHQESFTVQPAFEGNAADFGMVIPTPAKPKLQEMPKDFFRALAVFTILEPMDIRKYKQMMIMQTKRAMSNAEGAAAPRRPAVRILERGTVGSLEYKVLEADRADALYKWLKDNRYSYAGDQATLDYYVHKKWIFTVMKIDPRHMKRQANGSYLGEVTPTRFTFSVARPIYPLHITRISVKQGTDVLLYVMSQHKMDMRGDWSYEPNFFSMWGQAMNWAVPEMLTPEEKRWKGVAEKWSPGSSRSGAQLEWAGKLTPKRLDVLTGKARYNRDAPPEEVAKLKVLSGHLKPNWYLTKFRKNFNREEMTRDIELVDATVQGQREELEYVSILPTSPP